MAGPQIREEPVAVEVRQNAYDCPRGHTTWTVDVDEGVTPFMTGCQHPGCRSLASSRFYKVPDDAPDPTHEWYRPSKAKAKRIDRKYPGTLAHVEKGGLLLRERRA